MRTAAGGPRAAWAARPLLRRFDPWTLAFALLLLVTAAFVLYQGRGTTFYYDEWSIWGARRGYGADSVFQPVNGHNSALPIILFNLLRSLGDSTSYVPFRLALLVFHLSFLTLLFAFARPRLGGGLALCAVAPIALLGNSWLVFLMTFQGFQAIACMIAAVGALLLLERRDRPGDWGTAALLVFALFSFGTGVAVLAGVIVRILWDGSRWRRAWVWLVPAALFGVWYLAYRPESGFMPRDLSLVPSYVASGAAVGMGIYTSLGEEWGRILAVGTAALVVTGIWRTGRLSGQLAAALVMAAAFWALIAITRGPELRPSELRYLYSDAVFVLLIWLLLVPPLRLALPQLLIGLVFAAAFTIPNLQAFRDGAAQHREHSADTRADLFAIQTARDTVDPQFRPTDPPLDAGLYLRASADGKLVGFSEQELRRSPERLRRRVDSTLTGALRLRAEAAPFEPSRAVRPPPVTGLGQGALPRERGCVEADGRPSREARGEAELRPGQGLLVHSAGDHPAEVRLRRFGGGFPNDAFASVEPGGTEAIRFPLDRSRQPWRVQVSAPAPVSLCALPQS
jgi:hypothetical protein